MKEILSTQYYIHRNYINTYYKVYQALEKWISANIFRNDTSRVFMASNEYAFRRRFELTDVSVEYDSIQASSLQFPFSNYWPQNTGWQADQRVAANTAALVYAGIYEGSTKIKAASSVLPIPVQFYFDREDDARLAYEILYFKTINEHYYSTTVPYGNQIMDLPVNIKIKDVSFNPQFKESDWLKQNRIFVISATFDVRSYAISPPNQPDYNVTLSDTEDGLLSDGTLYDDGIPRYDIVDDVILNFGSNMNWKYMTYLSYNDFPIQGERGVIYVDVSTPEGYTKEDWPTTQPKTYRWDNLKGDYEEFNPCKYPSIRVDGTFAEGDVFLNFLNIATSYEAATLIWGVELSEGVEVEKVEFVLSNMSSPIVLEGDPGEYTFNDLTEGSYYTGYVCFYLTDGTSKKISISFNTLDFEDDKKSLNSLVGYSW